MAAQHWLLTLDTSGPGGGLAWLCDGALRAVDLTPADASYSGGLHARLAARLAELGLSLRQVATVAFVGGPGSFTGLRIAATVARVLHEAQGCGVIRLDTLSVLAEQVSRAAVPDHPPRLAVLMNARPGHVFCAEYERTVGGGDAQYREQVPPALREIEPWLETLPAGTTLAGPGLSVLPPGLAAHYPCWHGPDEPARVAAAGLLAWDQVRQGAWCAPEEITPIYLRPPECEEVYEQRRAAARARRGE